MLHEYTAVWPAFGKVIDSQAMTLDGKCVPIKDHSVLFFILVPVKDGREEHHYVHQGVMTYTNGVILVANVMIMNSTVLYA